MNITASAASMSVDPALHHEVEQFLFEEAAAVDERRFDDWLAMIADDVRYFMPVRSVRMYRDEAREFSGEGEVAHFDETKQSLHIRIKRLRTGQAWAEEPPSRTRHIVNNVRVKPADVAGEWDVRSNFFVYRSRGERQVDQFVGARNDILRRSSNVWGWSIARRTIYLDQTILLSNNLSIFF